jgi:hypothetical protein
VTERSATAPLETESDRTAVHAAIGRIALRAVIARIGGRAVIARALRDAPDRQTDLAVEAHLVEIATAREWAERTIPPKRWMD